MNDDKSELPFRKMIEVTGDDGSTTWINVSRFGSIEKFKKINFDENNSSSIVDIPQGLKDVLAGIPDNLPDKFKDETVKLAGWFTVMDRGGRVENEDFKLWLSEIQRNQVWPLLGVYPREAFAAWMIEDFGEYKLPDQLEIEEQKMLFEAVFRDLNKNIEIESNGSFVNFKPPELLSPDRIKSYISEADTTAVLKDGRLKNFLEKSDVVNSPFQLKLYEGGIVMYWADRADSRQSITSKMKEAGIEVVCAQDTYEFGIKEGKIFGPKFINSNDSSFARWVMIGEKYDQTRYFRNFIQFCIDSGRSPIDPYMNSFVYLENDGSLDSQSKKVQRLQGQLKIPLVVR